MLWQALIALSGFRNGAENGFTAWLKIGPTGVFLVKGLGAFR